MTIAEEADMAHTVMAARRHCLEMAASLVEPPIDYIIAHGNPHYGCFRLNKSRNDVCRQAIASSERILQPRF